MVQLPDNVHPVFARQVDCLARGDVEGVMDTYHPEAVVVRFQGVLRGHDEIRATFGGYMGLGADTVKLLEYAESEDTIMVRSEMTVMGEAEVGFGTYVLRDGRIWRQTAGIEGGMRDWFAEAERRKAAAEAQNTDAVAS
ncbi:nuclear transport factor 2 family protein [Micromonospora tulbaghiae]|uniref:nuclear transport factor 2 family protein n=1 Tax=Micromonospora tulbaghiae TaxID=479978 RepID=UPI0036578F60